MSKQETKPLTKVLRAEYGRSWTVEVQSSGWVLFEAQSFSEKILGRLVTDFFWITDELKIHLSNNWSLEPRPRSKKKGNMLVIFLGDLLTKPKFA
jgi:hypothetical protein